VIHEAKFRLLHQDNLDMHNKCYEAYFCNKGVYIMKFEKVLGEHKDDYFAVEFFDDKKRQFDHPKLTYQTYINGQRSKPKNIQYFEKEIESNSPESKLYQEVKDNVLKLYTEVTGEKTTFIKAVKYLFSLKKKPDDICKEVFGNKKYFRKAKKAV